MSYIGNASKTIIQQKKKKKGDVYERWNIGMDGEGRFSFSITSGESVDGEASESTMVPLVGSTPTVFPM